MRSFSFAVLLSLGLVSCRQVSTSDEDQVRDLAERFVQESLALTPSNATAQGYHEHHGRHLDELLDDYSPSGIQREIAFFHGTFDSANRLGTRRLSPESRADVEVIKLACQSQLFDFEQFRNYRHNPTVYVETIGNAIYLPLILNYAPESKRLGQIISRIEKIPAFLETAKANLMDSPEIWNEVARQENQGNLNLIEKTIREKIPENLKARYDRAATNAVRALSSFNDFLEKELSRHTSDWRLGPRLYAQKFSLTLATGDTPQQALADAEAKLESLRQEMRKEALAIYPKLFPGKTPSADLNPLISQVLDRIARQHATPETYFGEAKRDLAATTQFVKDHHLLALPGTNNLQVVPTPEFMRGIYAVGGFAPAPALEPQLGAYYWVTPFARDMTPERIESKLREYNNWGLKILTIHEAMPGHYVQFEYADRVQPPWRRTLRAIFSNGPYVEGWAVYATEFMIDAGYDNSPEMRLTFGKQMLRVVANTILDIKLQTMGMTDQQAMDLMIRETFQEKEEAEKKLQRAKLSSCQLPMYFVGWRGWDRMRDAYRTRQGSDFRLSEFNERGLKEGAVPLPALGRLLLP